MTRGPTGIVGRVRGISDDLIGIVLVVGLANLVVWQSFLSDTPLRILTGLVFILFVPGYALVAALFPRRGMSPTAALNSGQPLGERDSSGRTGQGDSSPGYRGIDRWERLALAFALSLATVPLLALVVTLSPYSLSLSTIFPVLSVFSLLCVGTAVIRRRAVSPHQRYHVSLRQWIGQVRADHRRSGSIGQLVLNLALVGGIVFAVGTLGFAVMASPDGEQFTEFSVLTEDADGELVAAGYPDTLLVGESQEIHTGIENEEGESVHYTVVVQSQRVEETDEGIVVAERVELDRTSVILERGDTWTGAHNLTVPESMTGTDIRIVFLLYRGPVPAETTTETAYRDLHLWVDIQSGDATAATAG